MTVDSVGHEISLSVETDHGDVSLKFITATSSVEIPMNYLGGAEAVAVAGQLAFMLGITTIYVNHPNV